MLACPNIVSAHCLCYRGCESNGGYGAALVSHVPAGSIELCGLIYVFYHLLSEHEFWDL